MTKTINRKCGKCGNEKISKDDEDLMIKSLSEENNFNLKSSEQGL